MIGWAELCSNIRGGGLISWAELSSNIGIRSASARLEIILILK